MYSVYVYYVTVVISMFTIVYDVPGFSAYVCTLSWRTVAFAQILTEIHTMKSKPKQLYSSPIPPERSLSPDTRRSSRVRRVAGPADNSQLLPDGTNPYRLSRLVWLQISLLPISFFSLLCLSFVCISIQEMCELEVFQLCQKIA